MATARDLGQAALPQIFLLATTVSRNIFQSLLLKPSQRLPVLYTSKQGDMYLIVVGAEPEGLHLIDFAARDGYEITLIEPNQDKARKALKHHDIRVLQGSIDEESILDEANADRADAIAATTLDDAMNLMAVMLGREYGIEHRVAIVRHTLHAQLFERTGAKVLSNPAEVVAKQLHQMVEASHD